MRISLRYAYPCIPLVVALLLCAISVPGFARENTRGGTAFLKSLAVPGWGQYSLEQKNSALAFFGTELALVGGMLTLRSYGAATRDDYEALASVYAGVNGSHGHDFYVDVGNWMTVDEYNEKRLQERNYDAVYSDVQDRWTWDSDAHRNEMKRIRIKSDRAYNSVIYLVGAMVLNHVASAIHAGRASVRQNAEPKQAILRNWNVGVQPSLESKGLRLNFTHSF